MSGRADLEKISAHTRKSTTHSKVEQHYLQTVGISQLDKLDNRLTAQDPSSFDLICTLYSTYNSLGLLSNKVQNPEKLYANWLKDMRVNHRFPYSRDERNDRRKRNWLCNSTKLAIAKRVKEQIFSEQNIRMMILQQRVFETGGGAMP